MLRTSPRVIIAIVAILLVACESDDGGSPVGPTPIDEPIIPVQHPEYDRFGGTLYDGWTPQPVGFPGNMTVIGPGGVGDEGQVQLCIWDYALIDGDIVRVDFAGELLVGNHPNHQFYSILRADKALLERGCDDRVLLRGQGLRLQRRRNPAEYRSGVRPIELQPSRAAMGDSAKHQRDNLFDRSALN